MTILTWLFVVNKVRVNFVDTEVSDVNELVSYVGHLTAVLLGGEPHQSLLVEIQPQGSDTGQQDVQPQVELQLVDEEGSVEVLLHHHLVLLVGQVG